MKKLSDISVTFVAGTLGAGGAERQLYYMLRALTSARASVRVLSLTRGEFWESRIRSLGVEVRWVGEQRSRIRRLWRIARSLRRLKPDLVQSQHFYANIYAAVGGRLAGVRDIGAIRNDGFSEMRNNGPVFGPVNLRLPRALIVNSRAGLENAIGLKRRPERVHFLGNVVDTDEFTPATGGAPEGILRILAVGRLVRHKRHDLILRAVARLRPKLGNIRLTIAGSGPSEAELRSLARDLGLGDAAVFAGVVGTSAVPELYRQADVFLLASEHEGTPNVAMEAMSAGVAVIATNVGGIPALIQHGVDGLLTTPGNGEELAAALEELARNAERRRAIGEAARSRMIQAHSIHSLPRALEGIYNAVIA